MERNEEMWKIIRVGMVPDMIGPYNSIHFETGAIWPTVAYATDYDEREWVDLSQGESITLANGNDYYFSNNIHKIFVSESGVQDDRPPT